jgi:hypothetical protein
MDFQFELQNSLLQNNTTAIFSGWLAIKNKQKLCFRDLQREKWFYYFKLLNFPSKLIVVSIFLLKILVCKILL